MGKMIHEELSRDIIGAAMAVLNGLRPGLDERFYERGLLVEMGRRGHSVDSQRRFPVLYQNEPLGDLIPDMIVDNQVIVGPKVVVAFNEAHIAQMVGYLAITGLELVLLLNFKSHKLDWKRVVRQRQDKIEPPDLHA